MLKIFIGYDHRQPISYTALQASIIAHSSQPVAITPLVLPTLPITRKGLTPFTFSRFLVPHLCGFEGWGLFLDADILLNADIAELFALVDANKAVMVSKSEHRFEWASVMLFNCGHPANRVLTPDFIENPENAGLHGINWCEESDIGDLPREWNHLVGYDAPKSAKLIHYTQGVPAWPETAPCEHAGLWRTQVEHALRAEPWTSLMGGSVHAVSVNGRAMPKLLFDLEKGIPKPEYDSHIRKLLAG